MKGYNKRIVICCDGTWNEPDSEPTNVVKIVRSILPASNNHHQVVFYDQGVGTQGGLDKYAGGAFGIGVAKNILDAYRFITHNYQSGDEIYCFGFSRGAYTIRALGGLLNTIGLLPKNQLESLPQAYAYYRTPPPERGVNPYKNNLRPDILMMGAWDTVGALGAPTPLLGRLVKRRWVGFFDTKLSKPIKNAYQALAVDERRPPFKADLWTGKIDDDQCVEQRWFAGVHSNIGGGYPNTGLSDLALLWMVEKAKSLGLAFDESSLNNLRPNSDGKLYKSYTGFYRLLKNINGKSGRRVLDGDEDNPPINVRIDQSVYDRHSSREDYEPKNLLPVHHTHHDHYTRAVARRESIRASTPGLVANIEFGTTSSHGDVVDMSEGGIQLIYDGDMKGSVSVSSSRFEKKRATIAWHEDNRYGLAFAA